MATTGGESVIISIDLEAGNAIEIAEELGAQLKALKDAQKGLASQNKQTGATYASNRQNIIELQREQRAYVNLANAEIGSNKQLRAQLSLLTGQYDSLSKVERENTTAGKALEVQIAAINRELLKSEGATGRFQRNVGNYQGGIGSSIQQFASVTPIGGFLPQVQALAAPFVALRQTIGFATKAMQDQKLAEELLIVSNKAAEQSTLAQIEADEAATAAAEARAEAERALTAAQEANAALQVELAALQLERITEEEAELAILQQFAAEQAALVAEEEARIAADAALLAETAELTAALQARTAAEVELAAATGATAAASEAAASSITLSSALATGGITLIIGAIIAAGAALGSFLVKLDSVSDGFEQFKSRVGGAFGELGRQIKESFDSGSIKTVLTDFGKTLIGDSESAAKLVVRMKELKAATNAAGEEAAHFTEVFQNLQDLTDINELSNQQTQNEVQNLRLQARNRKLGNDEKQRLLEEAYKMEVDQQDKTKQLHDVIIAESVEFAQKSLNYKKISDADLVKQYGLTNEQIGNELRGGNIQLANTLLNNDQISRDAYKKLKDGYALRNQDLQQANQQLEKIRNDEDKYAERARLAAEKREEELRKIREDAIKSRLTTAAELLTERQKELQDINADIDKRIRMYKKYNQDTEVLELERQSRIRVLEKKFYEEDAKIIQEAYNQTVSLRLSIIKNDAFREEEVRQQAYQVQLQNLDKQILEISLRRSKGEKDDNNVLGALLAERQAIQNKFDQDSLDQAATQANSLDQEVQDKKKRDAQDKEEGLKAEQEIALQRMDINAALLGSYENLFGGISELIGKNTVAGKIALALQKSFAIAEIIINAERAKAAVELAAAEQSTFYAALGPFGIGAIIAANLAASAKIAQITTEEVISVALVAAQTVSSVIGKAKGGIQYDSDGKGAVLPGYAKADNMNARLRSGEAVIVSEATRDPHTRNLLSAINVAYGGRDFSTGFASGGIYGGTSIQQTNSDVASRIQAQNQLLQFIASQKIYTSIVDLNLGQARYAEITEAGNNLG